MKNVLAVCVGLIIISGAIVSYKMANLDGAVCSILGMFGCACIAKGLEVENWF